MTVRTVQGELTYREGRYPFTVNGNEQLAFTEQRREMLESPGVVMPAYQ